LGVLYIVGTPIGNMRDITLRALDVLRQVSLIAAEDTRTTRALLTHYDITTPLVSYHEHNRERRGREIMAALAHGDVALVSDSGTPAISDPGFVLAKQAIESGFRVVPIPGPCAAIAALVASGLPTDGFAFFGFLPRNRSQRLQRLQALSLYKLTLVFYESPHRIPETLSDMRATLGNRQIAIARELTKVHEEIWRGTLEHAVEHFQGPQLGEFTLVVEGHSGPAWDEAAVRDTLSRLRAAGVPLGRAAKDIATASGWPRRDVYALGLDADNSTTYTTNSDSPTPSEVDE